MNKEMTFENKSEEVEWVFRAACESTKVAVRAFTDYHFHDIPEAGQPYYFGDMDDYCPKFLRFESEGCLARIVRAMDKCLHYEDQRVADGFNEVADVLESLDPKGFEPEILCCRHAATAYLELLNIVDMINDSKC